MNLRSLLPFAVMALLAACVEETPEEVRVDAPGDCPAGRYTTLIGQPKIVLRALNYDGPMRVINWGDGSDRSFQANRLTITIDANERIASVGCY